MKIIPQPQKISFDENVKFDFSKILLEKNRLSQNAKDDFLNFTKKLEIKTAKEENILFFNDDTIAEEGYKIEVDRKISIYTSSASGEFYALQTLKQMLFEYKNNLPKTTIEDCPKFAYRGFMLDVGRYFYSVSDIKKFLDDMALQKLNWFHFHLTEDQGWRVEIKKYPLLTEIGSRRSHTNFNNKAHGGYYTQEDIKEIVEYAHSKYIKIMPEIDIPGHSRAAIAAYPELCCFNRELPVATHWGVKHDILCAGKESVYQFVFDVIDELLELFPDGYIHIGGDEVFKHRWKICPECQKAIKENGLKNETELQEYFMNKVYDYLKEKGVDKVFMWNFDGLNPTILNKDIGFSLCGGEEKERFFVDTSTKAYYLDLPYGYISLKDSCEHKIDENAMGGEAEIWCEYIPNKQKSDIMTYPRILGLVESVWNGNCDYNSALEKLDFYYSYIEKNGINHSVSDAKLNPKGLRKFFEILLFERRQLTWEGVHNIFDDLKVERQAKKSAK